MAENFYTILTQVGLAKLANALVLGTQVDLTELAVGDGNGAYYNPVASQTALKNETWRGPISTVKTDDQNQNWLVIEAVIPTSDGGFMIREVGIFDDEGDMIAIGKYPETYKPIAADGSTKDLVIRMILEVSSTENIELKIDPTAVLATRAYVDNRVTALENQKGSANGIATLDANGHVPKSQLGNISGMEFHGNEYHSIPFATQPALNKTNLNQIALAIELETLKLAVLDGVTANIFIETFQNIDDIKLVRGIYDAENKRIYLP